MKGQEMAKKWHFSGFLVHHLNFWLKTPQFSWIWNLFCHFSTPARYNCQLAGPPPQTATRLWGLQNTNPHPPNNFVFSNHPD